MVQECVLKVISEVLVHLDQFFRQIRVIFVESLFLRATVNDYECNLLFHFFLQFDSKYFLTRIKVVLSLHETEENLLSDRGVEMLCHRDFIELFLLFLIN